jgi:putative endonuclease
VDRTARAGHTDYSHLALGRWGEDRVARWYVDEGYEVIDRNWHGEAGELDLVLARGHEIVFCEVKTRTSDRFGAPVEAVGYLKQRRIRSLAVDWLRAHRASGELRFDVASVLGSRISVTEAAF